MQTKLSIEEKYNNLKLKNEELQHEIDSMNLVFDEYVLTSLTDINGKILSVSKPFIEISGFTQEELLQRTHNVLRHEDMTDETFKTLWETISNKKIWRGEVKNRKKDGSHYWVDSTIIPLLNSKQEIVGYRAIRIDITESKKISDNFSHHLNEEDNDCEYEIVY
jgi:PAS domain S-box-containing protein